MTRTTQPMSALANGAGEHHLSIHVHQLVPGETTGAGNVLHGDHFRIASNLPVDSDASGELGCFAKRLAETRMWVNRRPELPGRGLQEASESGFRNEF